MGTLLESKEALRTRGLEVSLTPLEVNALIANRVDSLARLAFAACGPGETPTDEQINGLFGGAVVPNQGTFASMRRLIFEAHTLLSAELQNKVHKADDVAKTKLAPAERDNRVKEQKTRLEGLRFKGEEECSHQSYDIVLHMLEKDALVYLAPDKFPTRRHELLQRKAPKEISIDQTSLVVRDKTMELTCSTATELETTNAMRRRALAFDLVKACGYHAMNGYHEDLFDHLHQPPPPGYSAVSLAQLLRADRAAWLHIAERLTTLKRDEHGNLPLETEIQQVLAHPSVSFHLLPLPVKLQTNPSPRAPHRRDPDHHRAVRHLPQRPRAKAKAKERGSEQKGQRTQHSQGTHWEKSTDHQVHQG